MRKYKEEIEQLINELERDDLVIKYFHESREIGFYKNFITNGPAIFHRIDGPAVFSLHREEWYRDRCSWRDNNKPSVISSDRIVYYYCNLDIINKGQDSHLHREDGPAFLRVTNTNVYNSDAMFYYNGIQRNCWYSLIDMRNDAVLIKTLGKEMVLEEEMKYLSMKIPVTIKKEPIKEMTAFQVEQTVREIYNKEFRNEYKKLIKLRNHLPKHKKIEMYNK